MFGQNKEELEQITEQIERLWFCHNNLASLVRQITEIMKEMGLQSKQIRDDLNSLAEQTMRIAEQQNKLISHVMRSEDPMTVNMESRRFH